MRTLVIAGLAAAGLAAPAHAAGPSFDCAKAKSPDEKAICKSAALSELDLLLSDGYATLKAELDKETANKIHLPFLRQRRQCGANALCILQFGLAELDVIGPSSPSARSRTGCTSRATSPTPR